MIHSQTRKHCPPLEIIKPESAQALELPMVDAGISAGFPSPAEDYLELKLDLNQELVKTPSATFFGKVRGDSMIDAGLEDGDIIVIDKSLTPRDDSILVCFIDGEFTVKQVQKKDGELYLIPKNRHFKPIKISPESDFRLWGVVTYCIKKM